MFPRHRSTVLCAPGGVGTTGVPLPNALRRSGDTQLRLPRYCVSSCLRPLDIPSTPLTHGSLPFLPESMLFLARTGDTRAAAFARHLISCGALEARLLARYLGLCVTPSRFPDLQLP